MSLFLGIFLSDLFSKKNNQTFLKDEDILKHYFSELNENINLIKSEQFKNILSKLLCNEENRLLLDELFMENIILKKIAKLDLYKELVNFEINPNISFDSYPFFFSCR